MKIYYRLLTAALVATSSSAMAETNCQERVVERKPPLLPRTTMNFLRIVKQNGGCFVIVEFELDENGNSRVLAGEPSSKGCSVFVDSANKSVERSKFTLGTKEMCTMKIGFEFKP